LSRTNCTTAGSAPGSIIAAIIAVQTARRTATICVPMSMPRIWYVATAQQAPATPTVAAIEAVLVLVMAAQGEVGAATVRNLVQQLVVEGREQEAVRRRARVRVVDDAVLELEDVPT